MDSRRNIKMGIIVAILLLAVGFAAVTSTLNIMGTTVIGPNDANFQQNVAFNSATLTHNGSEVTNGAGLGTTANTNDTINVTIPKMDNIGDSYIVNYTIKNDSQYKARLGVLTCSITNDKVNASDYVTITPANKLKDTVLERNSISDSDTIRVEMVKSFSGVVNGENVDTLTFNISCNMVATAESAS